MSAGHRFGVRFIAVTVMTTHWHAVAAGETSKISRAIQWFHSRYARAFNRRYERFGHVFAERFKCKTVEEDGVRDRCGYVLGNPVKAGLCDRIADWPWSWCRYGLDTF